MIDDVLSILEPAGFVTNRNRRSDDSFDVGVPFFIDKE